MTTASDRPESSLAEFHLLFCGYVNLPAASARGRIASTVSFVRDGEVTVIIDPGIVPDPNRIHEALAALSMSPSGITDVIFSHHHPDHTLNAAMFPKARFHDHWAIYQGDEWQFRSAERYAVSDSIRFIETPGHSPQDITTLVGTPEGVVAFTHLWWSSSGPADDPVASDAVALHRNRERVLRVAALIVPGHGQPFRPDESTPR